MKLKMEEIFGSESSSGCESGWTVYLEHSHSYKNEDDGKELDSFTYEIGEEDMSMVSDASSGPQHFPEQDQDAECFKYSNNNNNNVIVRGIPKQKKMIHDLLDDTASSPLFNFSQHNNRLTVPSKKKKENVDVDDYSQGYSTTYFKEESAFEARSLSVWCSPAATKSMVRRQEVGMKIARHSR